MKRQAIKILVSENQVKSIQRRGDLHDYGLRRNSATLEESITKQIIKEASKLFPEVSEMERQKALAWEIQNSERVGSESSEVSAIRTEYQPKLEEANVVVRQAHRKMEETEQEMGERIEAIFNKKFDEAGITLFRSDYPYGLVHAKG